MFGEGVIMDIENEMLKLKGKEILCNLKKSNYFCNPIDKILLKMGVFHQKNLSKECYMIFIMIIILSLLK